MLMKSQILNARFGKNREADDLFLYYISGIPEEDRQYRAEGLQFCVFIYLRASLKNAHQKRR